MKPTRQGFTLIELSLCVTTLILLTILAMKATLRPLKLTADTRRGLERRRRISARALYQFDNNGDRPSSDAGLRGRYLSCPNIETR